MLDPMKAAAAGRKKKTSSRGRPPAHEAAFRANRLLEVATQVFLEQGFKGASMSEIARRAGASKQTLYARYPSKSELFAALMERKSSHLFEAIGPLTQDRSLRETLISFGSELLGMILTDEARGLHRLVIAECREFPELGQTFWKLGPGRMRAMIADYLRQQQSRGLIECGNPDHAVEALLGSLVSVVSMRANLGLPTPSAKSKAQRTAWVNYAVDLFLLAVQPGATSLAQHSPRL